VFVNADLIVLKKKKDVNIDTKKEAVDIGEENFLIKIIKLFLIINQ